MRFRGLDPPLAQSRVRAVMRRTRAVPPRAGEAANGHLIVGDFEIVEAQHPIRFRGADVKLIRMEYKLLRRMTLTPNVVLPHTELLAAAWGPEYANDLGYLRVYSRRRRAKIEPDRLRSTFIRAVQGVGYMLATAG